jgi:hypothetical protein
MEEVATPLTGVAHSGGPRPVTTENDQKRHVSAPLHAPHERADQVAIHRRWRLGRGRQAFAAAVKRWRQRNPEKTKAHDAVKYALRTGRLVKGSCELAGSECGGRVEAHHDDYSRPLDVRWLCKRHHKAADRARADRDLRVAVGALHLVVLLLALALSGAEVWR